MKRPFTAIAKNEEESADSTSTAPTSGQVFLDENASTYISSFNNDDNDNNDDNLSESESGLSENSKRMRKKRNAYQKISDEIRVNLLDAVKNGETLKSAAKRYKINYSSAKSILHTYRKEGRILKKSAQERTTKKKSSGSFDTPKTSSKSSKKENGTVDENNYKKPLEKISKKVKTEIFVTTAEEVLPLTQVNKNRANLPDYTQDSFNNCKTVPIITVTNNSKPEELTAKLFGNDSEHPQEHNFIGGSNSRAASRKGSMHQFKMFDNFQMTFNDMGFPDFSHVLGDNLDFASYRRFSQDFTSLNDIIHVSIPKSGQNAEHFHDPNVFFNSKSHPTQSGEEHKNGKVENLLDYDEHGDNSGNGQLKGFMDSQRMFRNNLRKASFLSFGSNSGFRKGSFDLF